MNDDIKQFELSPEGLQQAMDFASRTSWNAALVAAECRVLCLMIECGVYEVVKLGVSKAMDDLKMREFE